MNLLHLLPVLALGSGLSAQSDLRVPSQFPTVAAAITAASSGDRILLAPGTYNETGLAVTGKAIEIRSTDGAAVTTIDGGGSGPVLEILDVGTPGVTVRGLRITGGSSSSGGGILVEASSFGGTRTSAVIEDCVFDGNAAPSASGGGLSIQANTEVVVRNSVFLNNSAPSGCGGGIAVNGAVFGLDPIPSVLIEGCQFIDNTASSGSGAGLSASDDCVVAMRNCLFEGNATPSGGGSALSADAFGRPGVLMSVFGCTMAGNEQSAIDIGNDVNVRFRDTVVWGNANATQIEASVFTGTTTIDLDFCNIQGPVPASSGSLTVTQSNLLSVDPQFRSPSNGDYRLLPSSPMIDAGAPLMTPASRDAFGNPRYSDGDFDGRFHPDIGGHEYTALSASASDLGIAPGDSTTVTITADPAFQLVAATFFGSRQLDDFFLPSVGQIFLNPTALFEAPAVGNSQVFTNPGVVESFGLRLQAAVLLTPVAGGSPSVRMTNPVDLFVIQ